MNQHALEQQARRNAMAAGYVARKSRWRKNSIDNHGEFMIVDAETGYPIAGFKFDLSADDVIEFFKT